MLTWGIDWATEPGDRGAVLVDWTSDPARVVEVCRGSSYLKDDQVVDLLMFDEVDMVAVDVPFGWPVDFHAFLGAHQLGPVSSLPPPERAVEWRTSLAARRATDRAITTALPGTRPLAVSFDLLGATAASWAVVEAALERRGRRLDRSGLDGSIVETYPAAVRVAVSDLPVDRRELPPHVDLNGHENEFHASSHVRDACVAAIAARARALDRTMLPSDDVVHRARVEGWIHVPRPGVSMDDLVARRR